MNYLRPLVKPLIGLCLLGGLAPAQAIDWDIVPGMTFKLFYPGQRSWEFMLSRANHSGAPMFRSGKNCNECHDDDENTIAEELLEYMDPADTLGDPRTKPHIIEVNTKVASENNELVFRLEWTPTGYEVDKKLDKDYETKVTIMVADDAVRLARRSGCWMLCHEDAREMPNYKESNDVTKYIPVSRMEMSRRGTVDRKPASRIQEIFDAGLYVEYWQARMKPNGQVEAAGGHILEERHEHKKTSVRATLREQNGRMIAEIRRPFRTDIRGEKEIDPRWLYMVGIAIHEDHAAARHHYVSLEKMIAFDDYEEAHIQVSQQ